MDTSKQKFISHFLFVGEQCGKAEEAITFYMSLFKNSRLLHIERWSEDEDKEEAAGTVKFARFSLNVFMLGWASSTKLEPSWFLTAHQ
jgi:predicted 3-demethylubiquinone-9 3-methyltransferase (glyoxalase superfamily)